MAVKEKKNAAAVAHGRKGGKKSDPAKSAKLTPQERSKNARNAVQSPLPSHTKKALHLCLKRIKDATDEAEIRRLTEDLQRIVFHRQYQNAEN